MSRPDNLPDFDTPPLSEVVTGVQFEEIKGLSAVHYGEIWDLYRSEFPTVQEVAPLEPKFETFGPPGSGRETSIRLSVGKISPRLWFISEDGDHLIQYQPDRLLLNWRDRPDKQYPRYEACAQGFLGHLDKLSDYFDKRFSAITSINQVEISYINHIEVGSYGEIGNLVSLISPDIGNIEQLTMSFSETLKDSDGQPFARLSHEFVSVTEQRTRKPAIQWTITFRGPPGKINCLQDLEELLLKGRQFIVTSFDKNTTHEAHSRWGKK